MGPFGPGLKSNEAIFKKNLISIENYTKIDIKKKPYFERFLYYT